VISANVITDPQTSLSISQVNYLMATTAVEMALDCLWDNGDLYREMCCVIDG
jgi:hypothetical protein